MSGLGKCIVCGERDAVFHFTLRATITGPKSDRIKIVNFSLCEVCERANQQVWCEDEERRRRIALRMVHEPEFFSRYRDWRGKKYQSNPAG